MNAADRAALASQLDQVVAAIPSIGANRAKVSGQVAALQCRRAALLAGVLRGEPGDVAQLTDLGASIGFGLEAIAEADALLENAEQQIERVAHLVIEAPVPAGAAIHRAKCPTSIN